MTGNATSLSRTGGQRPRARSGFTLIEMICAVAIIAVMSSLTVPAYLRYAEKAREQKYSAEAGQVWGAVQMYFMENYGRSTMDILEALDELTAYNLNESENPLSAYLGAACPANGYIEDLLLDSRRTAVEGMVYVTGEYRITIDRGTTEVERIRR